MQIGSQIRSNAVLLAGSAVAIAVALYGDVQMFRQFDWWALWDQGGHMVLVKLLNSGLQPNVNFAYPYGPLTILSCQAWAALFGNDWHSFFWLLLLFRLVSMSLLVSIVARLRLSILLQAVFALGMFRWVSFNFSIAHPGEQIGLMLAIHAVMSSRFDLALAACALSTLFRPAAGFVVGFILIVFLVWQLAVQKKISWRSFIRALAPAAILELIVAVPYALLHGAESYLLTVLPVSGSRNYAQYKENYLTEGWGRFFPANQNWKGYLTNPSHLDLLVLLVIAAGLIVAAAQWLRRSHEEDGSGLPAHLFLVLVCVSSVVAVAMTVCYGGGNGVLYYYLPLFWLAAFVAWKFCAAPLGVFGQAMAAVVGINLAMCAVFAFPGVAAAFGKKPPPAETVRLDDSQLRVDKTEYDELHEIQRKTAGKTVALPREMGDVTLLGQMGITVLPNQYWCLLVGLSMPDEIARAQQQVRSAEFVLLKMPRHSQVERIVKLDQVPTELVYTGKYYELLRASNGVANKTAAIRESGSGGK